MSAHKDWRSCALRYLEIQNLKNQLYRQFRTEDFILKSRNDKNMEMPKYFALVVDFMLVADLSVTLAELIARNPIYAESIFVEVLEEMITSNSFLSNFRPALPPSPAGLESVNDERDPLRPFPMHIAFQLKGIPSNLFHKSLAAFKTSAYSNLIACKGIIVSLTTSSKYIRSGVYSCSDNMCPESIKRRIPITWKKNPKECHICSSNLVEHIEERDIGNVVKAIVITKAADIPPGSRRPTSSHFQHGITVKFYDNLGSGLKLGGHYDIAGYMGPKGMHAYYVQKSSPIAILDGILMSKLNSILALKAELEPSPWAFFIAVASQLSSDMYPMSSFLHLKRGILLSLTSLVCESQPIHVLAVGSENLPAHHFMLHASLIASSFVIHSYHQPVMGKTRWQEEPLGSNTMWLDAGSLYLAQGGICYMGEWGKHQKETQTTVLSAIERRQIAIVSEKRMQASEFRLPIESAIWTQLGTKKDAKLRPLIDVFGIPFIMDMYMEEENDVINHMLYNSSCDIKKLKNWELETKLFLQHVTSNEITVDANATKLIQDYFVASRRCRGLSNANHCLPIGSINVIMQMAEAHARISMHSTVTHEDALAAINLCEEALTALYGHTFMPAIPPLRIKQFSNWSQFSHEVDGHMKQFGHWVDKYLKDLIGDNICQMPREE